MVLSTAYEASTYICCRCAAQCDTEKYPKQSSCVARSLLRISLCLPESLKSSMLFLRGHHRENIVETTLDPLLSESDKLKKHRDLIILRLPLCQNTVRSQAHWHVSHCILIRPRLHTTPSLVHVGVAYDVGDHVLRAYTSHLTKATLTQMLPMSGEDMS